MTGSYRLVRVPGAERAALEAEATLELALSAGVPLPDGRVLVADGVAVSLVDLASGRRLGEAREVAPPRFRCEALSADEEGMVACYGPGRALVVVSQVVGPQPHIEMQVAPRGRVPRPGDEDDDMQDPLPDATASMPVSYGAGMLLVGATCAGVEEPGMVCVRHRGGQWAQSDERSVVRALGGKPWHVEFWVPREDGGISAVLIQYGCTTGDLVTCGWDGDDVTDHEALLDVTTGTVTHFDHMLDVGPVVVRHLASGHRYAPRRTRTGWVVTRDGMLRGYTARGSVAVDRLGNVSGHQPSFAALSAAGARAFARDLGRRWWQSTDYGATWIEVAGPPSNAETLALDGDPDCAVAGCFVGTLHAGAAGAWLRVGWPVEPPAATPTEGAGGEAL